MLRNYANSVANKINVFSSLYFYYARNAKRNAIWAHERTEGIMKSIRQWFLKRFFYLLAFPYANIMLPLFLHNHHNDNRAIKLLRFSPSPNRHFAQVKHAPHAKCISRLFEDFHMITNGSRFFGACDLLDYVRLRMTTTKGNNLRQITRSSVTLGVDGNKIASCLLF